MVPRCGLERYARDVAALVAAVEVAGDAAAAAAALPVDVLEWLPAWTESNA